MADSFDLQAYLAHLRRRWRFLLILLIAALSSSIALSLMQAKRYTARVSLLIEPPVTSDPRAAMAVSPIYLESLRTYEHFASSDSLFAEAAKKFDLRSGRRPLEDLKRAVLHVSIPKNTKILEIQATLPDPAKAHALAAFIAQRTVELNRSTGRATDAELTELAEVDAGKARERFRQSQAAFSEAMKRPPTAEALKADVDKLMDRRTELDRLALSAALYVAETEDRLKGVEADSTRASGEAANLRERLRSAQGRAARLRDEASSLAAEITHKQKAWAERKAEVDLLSAQYRAAQDAMEQSEKRAREITAIQGYRTERITMLDPGFVPERPSSPNIPLNMSVAIGLSLVLALVYLTIEFNFALQKADSARRLPRVVAKS
jgi:capsular polysaccharide biosynthesis protein